jgi:hypothetical protein
MIRCYILSLVLVVLSACGSGDAVPEKDPLEPFFRQEVGPPCEKNADCATGICDRYLLPVNEQDEAQGACSSMPFAVFAWQRSLLTERLVAVIGEDETLHSRVLDFAITARDAQNAPDSMRQLAEEIIIALVEDENLSSAQLIAAANSGVEGDRIRSARELASRCLPASGTALMELAISSESRFVRDAVVEGVSGCPAPLRNEVLSAATAAAMPYERGRFMRFNFNEEPAERE